MLTTYLLLPLLASAYQGSSSGYAVVRDHDAAKRHMAVSGNGAMGKSNQGPGEHSRASKREGPKTLSSKPTVQADSSSMATNKAAAANASAKAAPAAQSANATPSSAESPASMVEARATETKEAEATETTAEDAASKADPDPAEDATAEKAADADAEATDVAKPAEEALANAEKTVEKDAEAVVDTVADDADALVKGAAKELVGDVDKGIKDAEAGLTGDALKGVEKAALEVDACNDFGSCFHSIAINLIISCVGLVVYLSYIYGQRKSVKPDDPVKKEDFTGNMEPVALGACPGGMMSQLCCVAYFCNPCLRMELLGKFEKWDEAKTKTNMYLFVLIVMLGHIIVVFIAAGPLGLPKRWVHAAGLITVPLSILGLLALGQRMAQWRVRMKEKGAKKEGDDAAPSAGKEVVVSACCGPCAGGQEAEFIDKYEDAFGETDW